MTRSLFILLHSLWFFFLGFHQGQSRADRVVNLNSTIWLPLFWTTWTRARDSTSPHVLAWHMGRDYRDYRVSELTDSQVSGLVYTWFLENTEKMKALSETFLRLIPLGLQGLHWTGLLVRRCCWHTKVFGKPVWQKRNDKVSMNWFFVYWTWDTPEVLLLLEHLLLSRHALTLAEQLVSGLTRMYENLRVGNILLILIIAMPCNDRDVQNQPYAN